MDELKGSQAEVQKDKIVAEKPLEKSSSNGPPSGNKKPQKKSKIKGFFSRSTSLHRDTLNVSSSSHNVNQDVSGKGDAKGPLQVQKDEDNASQPQVQIEPASASRNVPVDVHNSKDLDRSEETEIILHEPETSVPQARPRQQKKAVTIFDEHQEARHRRNARKHDSSSQTRTCTNDGSRKQELKNLHRRNMKMKEKTKELLSLVEELTHNCEYYKNALKEREDREETEGYQCMKEKEALNLQIFKMDQEIEEWKTKCQKMENKNTALSKAKSLSKENKDLLEDIDVLKSVICRLNKELAYYQDKLRHKFRDAPENIPLYSTSSETDEDYVSRSQNPEKVSRDWLKHPRKSLHPLLVAYDEVIEEKEEIIKNHEMAIDRFKKRCLEITKENEDLHTLISANKDKGSISIDEWEYLRSNAVLVLEENDLLHDHVDNLKRKEEKLFSTFQDKVASFKQTIESLEAQVNRQKSIITELETKVTAIEKENLTLSTSLNLRIPKEKHDAVVQEFRLAFEDLKTNYAVDRKALSDKVISMEKERERLVGEVANLEADNSKLRADVKDCENNLVASSQALQQMKASILEATSARDATNSVIEDFMKHVQQLVAEKNKLLEDLNEQRSVNEQMMAVRLKENELVAELHGKIEAMERLHTDEIKSSQNRVKEIEEAMKAQKDLHRREKSHINELLREKDRRIETAEAEKKQLKQDLETVWRTTTSTMTTSLKNRNT